MQESDHTSNEAISRHNKIHKTFFIRPTSTYNEYFIVLLLNERAEDHKNTLISNLFPFEAINITLYMPQMRRAYR